MLPCIVIVAATHVLLVFADRSNYTVMFVWDGLLRRRQGVQALYLHICLFGLHEFMVSIGSSHRLL